MSNDTKVLFNDSDEFGSLHQQLVQLLYSWRKSDYRMIDEEKAKIIEDYSRIISRLNKDPHFGSLTDNLLFKHLPINKKDVIYTNEVMDHISSCDISVTKTDVLTGIIAQLLLSSTRPQLFNVLTENNRKKPSQLLFKFIHHQVIPAMFSETYDHKTMLQFCDLITALPIGFAYKFLRTSKIEAFAEFVETQIPQLRREKDLIRDWGAYCSTLIHYSGEILHHHKKLTNAILSIIETGFRIESTKDRLMAYDCWKTLILNYSIKEDFLNGPKQMTLLLKPLVVKLSKNPSIAIRRFDTCVFFIKCIKEPNGVLPELLNTIFGPFDEPVSPYDPKAISIQYVRDAAELWLKINQFLVEITTRIKDSRNLTNADKLFDCASVCTYLNSYYGQLEPKNTERWHWCKDMTREVWNQMLSMLEIDAEFMNKNAGRVAEILEELCSRENSRIIDWGILDSVFQSAFFYFPVFGKLASKELQHFATTLTRLVILNCDNKILFSHIDLLTNDWLKLNDAEALADFLSEYPQFYVLKNVCRYIVENIEGSKKDEFVKDWLLGHHLLITERKLYGSLRIDGFELLKYIPDLVEKDTNNLLGSFKCCCYHLNSAKNDAILYNNLITLLALLLSDRILSNIPIEFIRKTVNQQPFNVLPKARRLITDNTHDEDLYFCMGTLIDKFEQRELVTAFFNVISSIKNLKPVTPILRTAITRVRTVSKYRCVAMKILRKFYSLETAWKRAHGSECFDAELDNFPTVSDEYKQNSSEVAAKSNVGEKSLQNASPIEYSKTSARSTAPKSKNKRATSRKTPEETKMDKANNKTVDEPNESKKRKSKKALAFKDTSSNRFPYFQNIDPQNYEMVPVEVANASNLSDFDMVDEDESDEKLYAELETMDTTVNDLNLEVSKTVTPKNISKIVACDSTAEGLPRKRRGRPRKVDVLRKIRKTRPKSAESINHDKDSKINIPSTQEEPKTELSTLLRQSRRKTRSLSNELTDVKSDKLNCDKKSPSFGQPNASPKNSVPKEDTMTLDIIDNANVTDADTESFFTDESTLNLPLSNNCNFSPGNAESERSIVCNWITCETPKKFAEYFQDTTNILPIVKGIKVGNCEPKLDSTTVNYKNSDEGMESDKTVSPKNISKVVACDSTANLNFAKELSKKRIAHPTTVDLLRRIRKTRPIPSVERINDPKPAESGIRRSERKSATQFISFGNVNRSSSILFQTLSSPQTRRMHSMILDCADEDMKNNSEISAQSNPEDILTFNRKISSPLSEPEIAILKRKIKVLDVSTSPCVKRKQVNISDPATTSKKIFYKRDGNGKFVAKKTAVRSEDQVLETSEQSPIRTNVECAEEEQTESNTEKNNSTSATDPLANDKITENSTVHLGDQMLETSEQSPIMPNVECAEDDQTESSNEKNNSTSVNDLLQNEKNIRDSTDDQNVADLEKQIRMDILAKNLLALKSTTKDICEYYEVIRKCFDPSELELILNA